MKNPWVRLSMNAWALAFEASSVIGLRIMKNAAGGPAAQREKRRMIHEKIAAGISLQGAAMAGAHGFTAPSVIGGRSLTVAGRFAHIAAG